MIVKLIDSIVKAIYGMCVDDEIKPVIYTEKVEQGIELPCFFVRCLNNSRAKGFDTLYHNSNLFVVQYLPKSTSIDECAVMSEKLFIALEYITVDENLVRGTNLHCETGDETLSFFVDYDFNTYTAKERHNMEIHKLNTSVRE